MSTTRSQEGQPGGATSEDLKERRDRILHEELERRLDFLETSDDSVFGAFTTVDWIVCTLLFFALPLLVLGLIVL